MLLVGCSLPGGDFEGIPDGRALKDAFSCAKDGCTLDFVWHVARTFDDVPDAFRGPCQLFSGMVTLHNVCYEAECSGVCGAPRAEGMSILPLKDTSLVLRYPNHSVSEAGDNDAPFGLIGLVEYGACLGLATVDKVTRLRNCVLRALEELGYVLCPRRRRTPPVFCRGLQT